ncbi:PTS sugar transporter subunit IIA [Shimia ponticola]|uniref:PTS sugar transporter subunit IIA n=1 Tax=Shimia ponticola TaxID=2582893 RepID=UPI0011BE0D43|nr:PTS sugar transporter subunit IIA [Shimia ponticola]
MELSDILLPEAVKVVSSVSSKKRLFHELGDIMADVHGLPDGAAVAALMDRESLGPTGVGKGVALPHARMAEASRVSGCFLRLEKPVDYGAVDRKPVDLVFCLFAPEAAGVEHLKALALVSRTLRDESICAKLRANTTASTLHAILTETHASAAA